MGWRSFSSLGSKKVRKTFKRARKSLGLTGHSKIGRAFKKVQHLFKSTNSASTANASDYAVTSSGYTYSGKTLSQLTGGV